MSYHGSFVILQYCHYICVNPPTEAWMHVEGTWLLQRTVGLFEEMQLFGKQEINETSQTLVLLKVAGDIDKLHSLMWTNFKFRETPPPSISLKRPFNENLPPKMQRRNDFLPPIPAEIKFFPRHHINQYKALFWMMHVLSKTHLHILTTSTRFLFKSIMLNFCYSSEWSPTDSALAKPSSIPATSNQP